jgi:hypothetical protein
MVAFSELSLSFLGILNFFILALALIALHREHRAGTSLIGFGPLVVAVLGLCTFMVLMSGIVRARKLVEPQRISERIQTAGSQNLICLTGSRTNV